MPREQPADPPTFKVGDLVKIHNSGYDRVRIVELRGPLGPGGAQVYRVRVRRKPTPAYVEVLAEQLELVAGKPEEEGEGRAEDASRPARGA